MDTSTNRKGFWPFLKTVNLEPFVFFFMLGRMMLTVTIVQLYQDKLCANDYQFEPNFCYDLISNDSNSLSNKAKVLGDASVYQIYQAFVSTIPVTIISLFLGSWIDKYEKALKILLVLTVVGVTCELLLLTLNVWYFHWSTNLLLISFIPSAFFGSFIYLFVAAFTYIPKTTAPYLRPIRYALFELAFFIPTPIGGYLSGYLLAMKPLFVDSTHNFIGVFIAMFITYIIAFIWAVFVFKVPKSYRDLYTNNIDAEDVNRNDIEFNNKKWYNVITAIFDWKNARETIETCFRKRSNDRRLQLFLAIFSFYVMMVIAFGQYYILFQFTERVFGWNAAMYTKVNSIGSTVQYSIMFVLVLILVRKLKLSDILLTIMGIVSSMGQVIVRGTFSNLIAFYISYVIGSLNSLQSIGMRSFVARLVDKNELGKVFSVIASLEATIQMTSNLIFDTTLKLTIEKTPGLLFQILGSMLFIPLIIMTVIDILYGYSQQQVHEEARNEQDIENTSIHERNPQKTCVVNV